ncbi:SDR family NAD(P)-dependent oxidoreductase [Sphingobium sp.]|uniref:SDR family NAD(P)-dependent oxidoreductase n=1 Tax=Sphingobium sp. TaxID=1912891 RepID=UPI0028BE0E8A|nr:SDR family NAD(P)-dependent oxidoreductase [Sphingobium sp.]
MSGNRVRLDGQVAIITGAGRGVGRATASLLAERGAQLVINDMDGDAAGQVASEITQAGGVAIPVERAVGSVESARDIANAALSAFGRIDILINNAGISRPAPFGADSDEDIEKVITVNLLGPYRLMRAVWPTMTDQGYGRILNTASSAALGSGMSGAYAPSKAGLIGLTKEAAICGAPLGIQVNAVMPSAYTPLLLQHPDPDFRRWMEIHFRPEQVAALSAYLVSPDSANNGELFTAGGGLISHLSFARSEGLADPLLTPESVGQHIEQICRHGADDLLLSQQADLQAVYFAAYPLTGRQRL